MTPLLPYKTPSRLDNVRLGMDKPPTLFIENMELLLESNILKIFADCPAEAKRVIAAELEDVD